MSQENVEIVRALLEEWNRQDIDGMLALMHPDFEFCPSGVFPDLEPVYKGHAGFREFYENFTGIWESLLISAHELRDCGEQTLLLSVFEGRARDGLEVRRDASSVWMFRDGLAVSTQNYGAWSEALEAVGLSE